MKLCPAIQLLQLIMEKKICFQLNSRRFFSFRHRQVHTSILGVGFGILQVDLLVRDVHVSAYDDRFLGVQTLHIFPAKQGAGTGVLLGLETLQVRRERLDMALVHKYIDKENQALFRMMSENGGARTLASGRRKKHCITICQDRHKEGILC
jgi:hypothetical protein